MIFQNTKLTFLPCQAISQVRFQEQNRNIFISAVWDISFTHCINSLLKALLIQAKSKKLTTMLIKILNNFYQDYFLLLYWQTSSQNLNYDFICQQSALDGNLFISRMIQDECTEYTHFCPHSTQIALVLLSMPINCIF